MKKCERCFLHPENEHLEAYADRRADEILMVNSQRPLRSEHEAAVERLWNELIALCSDRADVLELADDIQNEMRLAAFDLHMDCVKQGFLDGLALSRAVGRRKRKDKAR